MSERMYPIAFRSLIRWIITERETNGTVFGVHTAYRAAPEKTLPIFGERIETPFGPAAGPNSQLAQNIIAAYVAGARFFEVKTVQKMDGAELAACVPRPCILADDEGYNQEWSTELEVGQALEEYIKAWCALKMMAHLWGYGDPDGFVFNMSVGYDLAGIQGEKIDHYIESMKDASATPIFAQCKAVLTELFPQEADFIATISPHISRSVTLSTLHGCPPDEIERIASYLLREKQLHTFVKCNPTILGYPDARHILDSMGYDYIVFDDHHFNEDLQWADAVPMFERLQALADHCGLEFGLKLSNTLPVDTTRGELPNQEMYMSGRALFPLTIEMCRRISTQFGGKMKISFAGGAEYFNCDRLFAAGIWPITVATTILKPGGYNRLTQMAQKTQSTPFLPFRGTDTAAIAQLSQQCRTDFHHLKAIKPLPSRKSSEKVPWLDCYTAPCKGGCPIAQDIPEYLALCQKGLYDTALRLITEKNPLPFITGTICAHRCMGPCTRSFYDTSVQIRAAKLLAAERGYDALLRSIVRPPAVPGKRAAIIGGGPTGIAAAYFLGRAGIDCTIYERSDRLGGIVRHVIPEFRISDTAIERDIQLMLAYGAELRLNTAAPSVKALQAAGYTHILYAIGAWKPGRLDLPGNVRGVIEWMRMLKAGQITVSGHVAVIGGGNTAMDAARAALRAGATSATIVYRRTRRLMPADAQELALAIEDGVHFLEQAAPVAQHNGKLLCNRMQLAAPDASGRQQPVPTGEQFEIDCDLVLSAVGEQVDTTIFTENGICLNANGRPDFQTNLENVYVAGDARRGPATVVEGIADAARFAERVIGAPHRYSIPQEAYPGEATVLARKGILAMPQEAASEGARCLGCQTVCQNCVDVCPNRANVSIRLPNSRTQILHIDKMCNECGNCTVFCPYASAPCKDKLTLFQTPQDMDDSENAGFCFLADGQLRYRLAHEGVCDLRCAPLPPELAELIHTVATQYAYLYQ